MGEVKKGRQVIEGDLLYEENPIERIEELTKMMGGAGEI